MLFGGDSCLLTRNLELTVLKKEPCEGLDSKARGKQRAALGIWSGLLKTEPIIYFPNLYSYLFAVSS